jgi:hypothetical protein
MTTTITWLGGGASRPSSVTWCGVVFSVGVPLEVADEALIAKARNNPNFKVGEGKAAPVRGKPAPVEPPPPQEPRHEPVDMTEGEIAEHHHRRKASRKKR